MLDNNKNFRIIDHPSDIGISITAHSLENAFEAIASGMVSIICDLDSVRPLEMKKINISCSCGIDEPQRERWFEAESVTAV